MQSDGVGRRERKKLETRRALVEAAQRLALERGPDQVTVEEIADAADVSVRTFFNYFPTKEDAVVGMDPSVLDAIEAAVIDRPSGEPPLEVLRNVLVPAGAEVERVADWWVRRVRLVREHPGLVARHLAGVLELERRLQRAIVARTGSADDDLYAAVVVSAAVGTFRMALVRWDACGRVSRLDDDLAQAFDLLATGLTRP